MERIKRFFAKGVGKLMLAAALVCAVFALTGCGATLSVYDYTSDGVRYNMYELRIDRDTVDRMEASAAEFDGKKYTVSEYFYELFSGQGYTILDAQLTGDGFTGTYRKAFRAGSTPELYREGVEPTFEYSSSSNPFTRSITATAPNPFNGMREKYDEVPPGQSSTLLQQLKNGRVSIDIYGVQNVSFPSVTDAFPYLKGLSPDGLLLNYEYTGSTRMDSSGTEHELGGNSSLYEFSRYFDTTEQTMTFEYSRPVAYGWYLVALLAGGVTVAIFLLVTREKKEKPTLLDRFPYNPEKYRDYESHLPMNK